MSSSSTLNQGYFDLLQLTYANNIPIFVNTIYNLNQNLWINTQSINTAQLSTLPWTYILLSPVVNPSYTTTASITLITYSQPTHSYYLISHQSTFSFSFSISPPSSNAHMIAYSVLDNDVLYLTQHNVTYRLDEQFYANKSSLIISPPYSHLGALTKI